MSFERGNRRRWPLLVVGGVVAAGVLTVWLGRPAMLAQPAPGVPDNLCTRLEDHGALATLPDDSEVLLQMVYRLGTGQAGGHGRLVPTNPDRLPIAPPTLPEDALTKPGFYTGVTLPTTPPRYAYLVRLADPGYIVGESPAPGKDDTISGRVVRRPDGVLATRVPFVPDGTLIICEVDPGTHTRRLHVAHELGQSFSSNGQDFKEWQP